MYSARHPGWGTSVGHDPLYAGAVLRLGGLSSVAESHIYFSR